MAITFQDDSFLGDQLIYTWVMDANGSGAAKRIGRFADKSYAMWGTWGGATVKLEGSWHNPNGTPDSASFITMTESDNTTSISFGVDAKGAVLENPVWIRPTMSNAGTTSIKIVVTAPWRR